MNPIRPFDPAEIDQEALNRAMTKITAAAKRGEVRAPPAPMGSRECRYFLGHMDEDELRALGLFTITMGGSATEWRVEEMRRRPRETWCSAGAQLDVEEKPRIQTDGEEAWRGIAGRAWEWSYKWMPDNDSAAVTALRSLWHNLHERDVLHQAMCYGLPRWADGAYTTLTCGHKLFASLALTHISPEAYDDIKLPWPAFVINLPDGLIVSTDGAACTRVRFCHLRSAVVILPPDVDRDSDDAQRLSILGEREDLAILTVQTEKGELLHHARWGEHALRECLFDDDLEENAPGLDTVERRVLRACQRALVGLLYTFQNTAHHREHKRKRTTQERRHREGPPDHRTVMFGAPVNFDVRQNLRDWISGGGGRRASPSVQWLVRGHYKTQPYGPRAQNLRKWIWREPYWAGPEGAPIKSREHVIE